MFIISKNNAREKHITAVSTIIKYLTTNTVKKPPTTADVVIIGGGSTGCSVLYQLAKKGIKAVLVEHNKLGSGTSSLSAGILWNLQPNDIETELLKMTNQSIDDLRRNGLNVNYVKNGSLSLARRQEREKEFHRIETMSRYFGIDCKIISPDEAAAIFPNLMTKAFYAALYCPSDGNVHPASLCNDLAVLALTKGAMVVENCTALKISTEGRNEVSKIVGIETSQGVIKTECIVNAAGIWANALFKPIGFKIPYIPIKHGYVVTDIIPALNAETPNLLDPDASLYCKTSKQCLRIGFYENDPDIVEKVSSGMNFSAYKLDPTVVSYYIQQAAITNTLLAKTKIKKKVCGVEGFTPDGKPILGEDPRIAGLFHACAFNGRGTMLASGCAEQLAVWISEGRPNMPIFNFDIRRFNVTSRSYKKWIVESSRESYAKSLRIAFPNDQPLAGRNFETSIFHEVMLGKGAFMEEERGWERPGFFIKGNTALVSAYSWDHSDIQQHAKKDKTYNKFLFGDRTYEMSRHHDLIEEEALAARTNVIMSDLSYFRKMYLTGHDAQKAAEWIFTNNTEILDKAVYTCALNKYGGVAADMIVIKLSLGRGTIVNPIFKGNAYYIVAGGLEGTQATFHIKREIARKEFEAQIYPVTEKIGVLSIQGPKSRELLQSVTNFPITLSSILPERSVIVPIDNHLCRVIRRSFIGEMGYELHIPLDSCLPVYEKLNAMGPKFNLRMAGFRALHSLSCEKGVHLWDFDLRTNDNPVECNLTKFCRTAGSYLGKEIVERHKKEGVKKLRAMFFIKDRIPLHGNELILKDEKIVGILRRGNYAYFLKASVGIGYVSNPDNSIVTEASLTSGKYQIEAMGKRYAAHIFLQSPFDSKDYRLRGLYEREAKITA